MEKRTGPERRSERRERIPGASKITFWIEDKSGSWTRGEGEIGDRWVRGVGLILNQEVAVGQNVILEGDGFAGGFRRTAEG